MIPYPKLEWRPDPEGGLIAQPNDLFILRVGPSEVNGKEVWQGGILAQPEENAAGVRVLLATFYSLNVEDAKQLLYALASIVEADFA